MTDVIVENTEKKENTYSIRTEGKSAFGIATEVFDNCTPTDIEPDIDRLILYYGDNFYITVRIDGDFLSYMISYFENGDWELKA